MESSHLSSMHVFQAGPAPSPSPYALPQITSLPQTFSQQTQPTPATAEISDRARQYKSRNRRPCDFCRYKKAACHLVTAPPCELCIRYNKDCTFVESPAKRRRHYEDDGGKSTQRKRGDADDIKHDRQGSMSSNNGTYMIEPTIDGSHEIHRDTFGWDPSITTLQIPAMDMHGYSAPAFASDPSFYQDTTLTALGSFEPLSASTVTALPIDQSYAPTHQVSSESPAQSASSQAPQSMPELMSGLTIEPSLAHQASFNATIVGLSGETDPYLLSRFRYDERDEAALQSMRIRKVDDGLGDDGMPTFFAIQHNALALKAQPQQSSETLAIYRREVEAMVSDEVGRRLIRLFYHYVQPYFPILSREGGPYARDEDGCRKPKDIPTHILAAIYGHALPFCAWDEKLCVDVYTPPSADALFKIAWASCMSSLHTPSYESLQTLLMMVQRRPTNRNVSDTPFKGVMISAAVSTAQSLGLFRDPSSWPLPVWEVKQRKRLAWATFVQDRWLALNAGRSPIIRLDDWDIEMLTANDLVERNDSVDRTAVVIHHFVELCKLTLTVDDVLRQLYSVRATKALHRDLGATTRIAEPLLARLSQWQQDCPSDLLFQGFDGSPVTMQQDGRRASSQHELDGNSSLRLAYITAKIMIYRAMLRPCIDPLLESTIQDVRTGSIAAAHEAYDFLESLNARELEAFWASYSRTNFTIVSSFMLLLFVTSPSEEEAKECLGLLNSWRALLRVKSRSCDLLNLALLKIDGVFVAGIDTLIELSPAAAKVWRDGGGMTKS